MDAAVVTIKTPTNDALLLATCRADPTSTDVHDHLPLAAGHYRLMVIERTTSHPLSPAPKSCNCYTCTETMPFTLRANVALPKGDIILVVHGFNCTEAAGIMMTYNIRDALAAWGLPLACATDAGTPTVPHVMAFTWPCEHSLLPGYMADKEGVARFASFSLANLLADLRRALQYFWAIVRYWSRLGDIRIQ